MLAGELETRARRAGGADRALAGREGAHRRDPAHQGADRGGPRGGRARRARRRPAARRRAALRAAARARARARGRADRARRHSGERLLNEEVGPDDIAEVVAAWTGIPVSRLLEGEMQKLSRSRRACTSAWSVRTRPSRRSPTPSAARARALGDPTGRSARSCSSGRRASARPSSPARSPRCSSTTSAPCCASTCPSTWSATRCRG